ncbi:unnamed protein product, partial [Rotaria socialis]
RRINAPAQSSTPQAPKRNLGSSDNDGAQISKQQRVLSNGKQKTTREMNFSKVTSPVHQMNNNLQLDQPRQQASVQQQHQIPFEQLTTKSHLDEYNSTLKLGRISIGNTFCTITPFLTGNRMTYCTRCWCLGHMRDKFRCAQCDGYHHSLSSECEKVVEYRSNLKEQVENALSAGKLQRLVPQDHVQPTEFRLKQNEFPSLPALMSCITPWKQTSVQSAVTNNINGIEDITKILLSINQNILDMKDNTRHVELHNETLMKLLPTLASLVDTFIWPMMLNDVAGLRNKQDQLQKIYSSFNSQLNYLKTDYTARRKRSSFPLPQLSPSQPTSNASINTPNNETDQNMSR